MIFLEGVLSGIHWTWFLLLIPITAVGIYVAIKSRYKR